jgi:hypothetical protein
VGRARRRTTISDPAAAKAADLLQHDFAPNSHALDTARCGDITYVCRRSSNRVAPRTTKRVA